MPAPATLRAVPDPDLVRRFAPFPVRSRLPMEGGFTGLHRGLHRGAGAEFAEYRRYAPGDDVTRLDWRVYGRSDRFYVKEAEADSDLACRILIDATASMGFGSTARTKLDTACAIAAVLAVLLIRQGDAVGLTSAGGTPAVDLAPRRRPAQAGAIGAALSALQAAGDQDLAVTLREFAKGLRRRGLVWVFSDAFGDPDTLVSGLGLLAHRGHDVTLFEVADAGEDAFDLTGPVRFEDLEGGRPRTLAAEAVAAGFRQRLRAHREHLRRGCAERGVRVVRLDACEDVAAGLARFLGGGGPANVPGGP